MPGYGPAGMLNDTFMSSVSNQPNVCEAGVQNSLSVLSLGYRHILSTLERRLRYARCGTIVSKEQDWYVIFREQDSARLVAR